MVSLISGMFSIFFFFIYGYAIFLCLCLSYIVTGIVKNRSSCVGRVVDLNRCSFRQRSFIFSKSRSPLSLVPKLSLFLLKIFKTRHSVENHFLAVVNYASWVNENSINIFKTSYYKE